jgi:hypothetical protein
MFEVMVKYNDFTSMVEVDDACYTADDIKTAFLEIAENNGIEDIELIDNNSIEIDYSDLPTWLDESSLEEFFDNYPNSSHDDLDLWEAAHDCGVEFSNVDEAYVGQFNSDEEFTQDLCNKNFRKTWKLVHISDMYYYFRDNSDGTVGKINQDQFHSQVESGYYTILQQNQ